MGGQSPQNSYGTGQAYQSYGATVPTTNYGYGGNQATTTMKMDPSTPLVPPGEGKWRSSLFSCCSDMYICFSVCCCHAVTTGQLYERSVQKNMMSRIPLISCLTITLIIFVLEASQNVTSYIFTAAHYQQDVFGGIETAGLFDPVYWKNMTMHSIGAGDMDRVATHHATMIRGSGRFGCVWVATGWGVLRLPGSGLRSVVSRANCASQPYSRVYACCVCVRVWCVSEVA